MPRLDHLTLTGAAIGDAALAALVPALRRRPALQLLYLNAKPFGDEGLAALVAPPPAPPAGTPPPPIGGLKKLEAIDLSDTQVSDVGCATLVAALHRGALPALEDLLLRGIPASEAAKAAVQDSIRANLERAYLERAKNEDEDEWEDEDEDEGEWDEDEGS